MGDGASIGGAFTLTPSNNVATITVTGNATISCILAGGKTMVKAGTGTLTLSGDNTFTKALTISGGILKLGANGGAANTPLGTTGGGTVVSAGAALDLNGYTLGIAEILSLDGTGISSGGALMNSSATPATYSGVITFTAVASIVGEGGTIAITGTPASGTTAITLGGSAGGSVSTVIAGTSATRTLTKVGTGTWTLSGANTYIGATTISAGTLKLGNAAALGTVAGGVSVTNGAALDLNGITCGTAEPLTLNGTGVSGGGALTNSSTGATYSGPITFATAASIVGEGGTIAITGTPVTGVTAITLGGSAGGSFSTVIAATNATRTITKE